MSGTERLNTALAGRYRIEKQLGQGGMATVYLAEDLKHDRKVAVKVLKPELAAVLGAERFVVEIKTTAALQHPHILPLFDSGTTDGFLYYVMPYIEGETLRGRLSRETQLGIDEAVGITTQVADALDYAHRHGVIHRDIKPENILLHDGRPMVADFGIALAVSAAAGGRMTETGLSLGTPHYMSPEQATAEKEITGRSDIYSLASVMYEMLAGQPPHLGGSAQQIIMKIIAEPAQEVTKLRKSVPPHIAAALSKALEKVPADRFESAKAFASALTNPAFRVDGQTGSNAVAAAGAVSKRTLAAVVAASIVVTAAATWSLSAPAAAPATLVRQRVDLFTTAGRVDSWRQIGMTHDGLFVAFVGGSGADQRIWLKTPERVVAQPMAGTDGGAAPTFSPNGEWIAFVSGGKVRKVRLNGGDVTPIADGATDIYSATAWLDDGTVLFADRQFGLSAVNQDGGRVRVLVPRDSLPNTIVDITAVPGGRTALFSTCASNCAQAQLWAVNLTSGARGRLVDGGMRSWSVDGGLVVYADRGTSRLFAASYDEAGLSLRGTPTLVLDDVRIANGGEGFYATVAAGGTLLYLPLAEVSATQAVWVTRDGKVTPVDSAWSFLGDNGATISPDGQRLAISILTGTGYDIWIKELVSGGTPTRLTFDGRSVDPQWTADGNSIVFISAAKSDDMGPTVNLGPTVRRRRVDGSDSAETIFRGKRDIAAVTVLRDTTTLLLRLGPPPTRDIYLARRRGGATGDSLAPLLASDKAEEVSMTISPDERWMAYQSNESSRFEVSVVPFPNVRGGPWQVSLAGGRSPRWARSGRELFFIDLDGGLVSVPVSYGASPTFGKRQVLFSTAGLRLAGRSGNPVATQFDVTPDDRRFLFVRAMVAPNTQPFSSAILVQNWLTDVRQRLKGSR